MNILVQVMFWHIQSCMESHLVDMISWSYRVSELLVMKLTSPQEFCLKKHGQKAMETLFYKPALLSCQVRAILVFT